MKIKKEQSGMVMIEAIYVLLIAIMVVFLTANFAVLYHNRLVLTSVANETANAVAEIYGSVSKEPKYAYAGPGYFYGRDVYRHYSYRQKALELGAEKKAKWYGSYLLYESEFADREHDANGAITDSFDDLNVTCEKNELGLWEVKVSIEKSYPVFLNFPSQFFGMNLEYAVKAEGKAICYDIIYQMNSMALVKELQNKFDSSLKLFDGIDKILETINTLMNLFKS